MNNDKGRINFGVGLDNSKLQGDAAETRNILQSIGDTATKQGERMESAFSNALKAAGGLFAMNKIADFTKDIIAVRGEIESLQISFETLAGKQKGNELFGQIKEFAVKTPMMMKDLASGAQTMLAFNIDIEKVMPTLKAIGDISMGDAQKFNSLTLAFSQMSATGKLMGQDLLQMINAGFNPLSVISEKTGKSIGDLKDEMSKGKITVEMVEEAFMAATSEGGKFYGMLEKQSHGVNGALSNLEGAVDDMLNDLGEKMQGTLLTATNVGTYLAQHYQPILDILGVIIATYGTYRAALMLNAAMENVVAKASADRMALLEAEIAAVGTKTAQEQLSTDADIAAAVAKGNLTEAEGLQILALKQEAAARVQTLATAAKQAEADALAATTARQAAGVRLQAAEANAAAMRIEYEAALAKGEVFEIAVAKERMETAQTEINTAAQQYQAAATAETTAQKAAQTAQTTANTAAQELNNVAVEAGTVKTGVFASAVGVLNKAFTSLWATIMKHPLVALLAVIAAVGVAIYNCTKKTKELNVAQQALDDVSAKAAAAVETEKTKIETLSKIVHDNTKKLNERKTALNALQKIVPDYHAALTTEGRLINDNTDALNRYIEALLKAAKLEAIKGNISSTFKSLSDSALKVKNASSDYGWFLNLLTPQANIDKNKKNWGTWFDSFLKDPTGKDAMGRSYMQKNSKGDFQLLFGSGEFAQYLSKNTPKISDDSRALIESAEQYYEMMQLYQNILSEDVAKQSSSKPKPTPWKTEVENKRKELSDAQQELARLKQSATATVEEVKAAQDKVDEAKKSLKGLGVNVDKEAKAGNRAANIADDNADMLTKEAADRRKQTEEYTKRIADQNKDSEFEIRQARIDAMKEGIERELAQNQLNYDRLTEQNSRRLRDMLDELADQRIRDMEDKNPTVFKKKNSDGKWEEDPGAREDMYRTIRVQMTVDDLSPEQQKQIAEFASIAEKAWTQANKEATDQMLSEVLDYNQKRARIEKEYAEKRKQLYVDGDESKGLRQGVSEGNVSELERQRQEALAAVDEEFASREETYQAWCNEVANLSLKQLQTLLANAKAELDKLQKENGSSQQIAVARAKVTTAQKAVKNAQAKNDVSPKKRSVKEWEDLYKTLQECEREFEAIGDAVGGTAGEIISTAGQIATSSLQMINGIVQLVNMSKVGIEGTAMAGATAISTMEKASVILTIISAAMQIAMTIINLFNDDEKKQEEIEALQERIDQLQWELDHLEINRYTSVQDTLELVYKTLQETRLELVRGAQGWEQLVFWSSKVGNNQTLLEKSAAKLADYYGTLAYTADKALGENKYKEARSQLENIAQQQLLISQQIDAERSKKDSDSGAIQDYENKIAELGQQALELINELVEDIIGGSSNDIAEELADAFIEAFQAGEDAAEAWGEKVDEIVADIMKRMLISKFLEEPLGEIFNKYKDKWFPNGQAADNFLDVVIGSMNDFANDLNVVGQEFSAIWENLPESVKNMFTVTADAREADQGGIATASQDSVDELNARITTIQGHTYEINATTKGLLVSTNAILQHVMNIDTNTASLKEKVEDLETGVKSIRANIEDIAIKGVKLK